MLCYKSLKVIYHFCKAEQITSAANKGTHCSWVVTKYAFCRVVAAALVVFGTSSRYAGGVVGLGDNLLSVDKLACFMSSMFGAIATCSLFFEWLLFHSGWSSIQIFFSFFFRIHEEEFVMHTNACDANALNSSVLFLMDSWMRPFNGDFRSIAMLRTILFSSILLWTFWLKKPIHNFWVDFLFCSVDGLVGLSWWVVGVEFSLCNFEIIIIFIVTVRHGLWYLRISPAQTPHSPHQVRMNRCVALRSSVRARMEKYIFS